MRELTMEEVEQVSGGFWPVVLLCLALAGCSHMQPLRRGEKPGEEA